MEPNRIQAMQADEDESLDLDAQGVQGGQGAPVWWHWLAQQLHVREGEGGENAFKRLVEAIAAILDSDVTGRASGEIERLINHYDGDNVDVAHQAFRAACARATARLGARRLHASLLMAPVLIRGPSKLRFPRQIDPITCATIQNDAAERLKGHPGMKALLVPVSAVISIEELDNMPATMLHRLLCSALDAIGAKKGMPTFADAPQGCQANEQDTDWHDTTLCLHWGQMPSVEDTHVFVERHANQHVDDARWVAPRFVVFVCIAESEHCAQAVSEIINGSQGWSGFVGGVLRSYRLEPEQLAMIHDVRHPLSSFMAQASGLTAEEHRKQSISVLGIYQPARAIEHAVRTFALAQAQHELKIRAHAIEMTDSEPGSIIYNPTHQMLSIRFRAQAEEPVLQIRMPHSVRLYPFISELTDHMTALGCPKVEVSVLDSAPHSVGSEESFRIIH